MVVALVLHGDDHDVIVRRDGAEAGLGRRGQERERSDGCEREEVGRSTFAAESHGRRSPMGSATHPDRAMMAHDAAHPPDFPPNTSVLFVPRNSGPGFSEAEFRERME